MAKFHVAREYERAEESRRICIYNLENQKKKFEEINREMVRVEKILNNRLLPADKHRSQVVFHQKLRLEALRLSGLIQELEGELKAAEENLSRIKKNYST